jgi:GT2 family glycosyltransferase
MKSVTPGVQLRTIVLDNGSKERLDINEKDYQKIGLKVIVGKENLGFTGGHNLIWNKICNEEFDYFLLLNNDSLVDESCIKTLVNACEDEGIGGVVPKIYFTKGHEFHTTRYKENEKGKVFWFAGGHIDWANVESVHRGVDEVDHGQYDKKESISFATGACFLLKKTLLTKIGLFDNRYFLYYEDADLSQKVLQAGKKLLYVPEATVWHNNAGSSGSGSALHDYYLTRNKMLFGMKYAPIKTRLHLIKNGLTFIAKGRPWQKKGAQDFFTNKFGKGSYR